MPALKRLSYREIYLILGVLLIAALIASASVGAFMFSPTRIATFFGEGLGWIPSKPDDVLDRNVFFVLRLPRVLLCGAVGATLGVSGALMQGLFRNPIVEPGLAGTSAGAALGAAIIFVFGESLSFATPLGSACVPILAFLCSFGATMLVYRLSTKLGRTDVFTLLLAGIAINAMCNAGTGFLSYIAHDPQARNITFWNLGTFTTADWHGALLVTAAFALCFLASLPYGKALNALMLGEDDAAYTGIEPEKLIFRLIVINTIMVSVATAMVGVIAFVGLVVPHLLRLLRSSDYTFLLPASAMLGALLMEIVDIVARLVIQPAELPIGIITALIGAPFFLWILIGQRQARSASYG